MLNPSLNNFSVMFSSEFFPEFLIQKYDNYLFHKNYPFKTMQSLIIEGIQSISVPGIGLQTITVTGMENTGSNPRQKTDQHGHKDFPAPTNNRVYPGTSPLSEISEGQIVTISYKNYLINWMYMFEIYWGYYRRSRTLDLFNITLTMKDSSEIDQIRFRLEDCFLTSLPNLVFSFTQAFNESQSFDVGFIFQKYNVDFCTPSFDLETINLSKPII
jgi:hypothetical protein